MFRFKKIRTYHLVILFSVIFWYFALSNISSDFSELGGDSAQYIIIANSINNFTGYRAINFPQEPFVTHYPPVFPLLLAVVIFLFGNNFFLMHVLIVLFGYLSLGAVFLLLKKYWQNKYVFLIIVFFAFSFSYVIYSTKNILSDIPYLFFSIFSIFWLERYIYQKKILTKEAFLTAVFILLSFFCRYLGVSIFIAAIVALIIKREFRKASFISSIFLLAIAAWSICAAIKSAHLFGEHLKLFSYANPYLPNQGKMLLQPQYLMERLISGLSYYYKIIGESIIIVPLGLNYKLPSFLNIASVFIVLSGLISRFIKSKYCSIHYYFLVYLFMIIISNHGVFGEGKRYILPILPLLFFYFFSGLKWTVGFLKLKIRGYIFWTLTIALFISNLFFLSQNLRHYKGLESLSKPGINFLLAHRWMAENLTDEAVIYSRKPTVTYLYTGHKSVCYPFTHELGKIYDDLICNNVKYIVVDEFSYITWNYLDPFVEKYRDNVSLLHQVGDTAVFRVEIEEKNN